MTDVLIKSHSNLLLEKAHAYLADYLTGVAEHDLKQLLNSGGQFQPGHHHLET